MIMILMILTMMMMKMKMIMMMMMNMIIELKMAGSCTSIIALDKEGEPLIIVSDPNLWLYSPSFKYEPEFCDLEQEYGGCKIDLQGDVQLYTCIVPRCSIKVHLKCDTTIKGKPNVDTLMCPKCRDIDPETSRKRPKKATGRGRGRPKRTLT